ncbi:DoxX family protein [Agrobacterium deltaense]
MNLRLDAAQPYVLAAMRIGLGLVILSFGMAKVFGLHAGRFTVETGSLAWIGGGLELVLGFFFLVGFKTRLSAFLLSGEMAVAYFLVHFPISFFPTENEGYAAAVYSLVFLYFVTSGPGPLSIDRKVPAE